MTVRGADFFQERAPAWARTLSLSVALPGGVVVTGSKARVYDTLRLAKETGTSFQVGRRAAPAGWVPTWVLREPWCGGAAGDRRLRDLREAGVTLESQTFDGGDEASSSTWLWRLGDASLPAGSRLHQVKAGPLGSLRFRTYCGRPGLWAGTLIDVTPGSSSWAAPSGDIQLRFTRRETDGDVANEAYRQELLQRWKQGKLPTELQPHSEISFFHRAGEGCFDPLPCLVYALTRLGALHLNPVQEVR